VPTLPIEITQRAGGRFALAFKKYFREKRAQVASGTLRD
jgi:hypothetical protein